MTHSHHLDSNSLQAYRYRVHLLARELWQEKNPLKRLNITLQLADATTHLAKLEAEVLQEQYNREFERILQDGEKSEKAIAQLQEQYVDDEEQNEIDRQCGSPEDYEGEEFIDMTDWVKNGNQI
ncbi:MAG: hypothetical protein AB4290_15040 [Spirulina sp.]